MKTLKEYILESESTVAKFLKDNYKGNFRISTEPNKDGKYEVSSTGKVYLKNTSATSLTNGEFIFTECKVFVVEEAEELENLEGFPQNIKDQAILSWLNITDLTGMPEKLKGSLKVTQCSNLSSLKGCPKEIGGMFECSGNKKLMGLEDGPTHVGEIYVDDNGKKFTKSYITGLIKIDKPEFGRGY